MKLTKKGESVSKEVKGIAQLLTDSSRKVSQQDVEEWMNNSRKE